MVGLILALSLSLTGREPVATLAANERDLYLKAIVWTEISPAGVRRKRVSLPLDEYRVEIPNWGTTIAISDRVAIAYAEKGERSGLLAVWRNGSTEFVPTGAQVVGLRFIAGGTEFIALRPSASGGYESQVRDVRHGLPSRQSWLPGVLLTGASGAYVGVNKFEHFSLGKIISSDAAPSALGRAGRLLSTVKSYLHHRVGDSAAPNYPQEVELSSDSRLWLDERLETLSGGLNEFDPTYLASGVLSETGLVWQWKFLAQYGPSGCFFTGPNKVAVFLRYQTVMGPPRAGRRYPAGLYTIDLRKLSATRSPLSSKLIHAGVDAGDLVAVR
jgi:hypothetical protein